jgi:hypothetical protein
MLFRVTVVLQVRSDDSRRSHSVHQLTLAALGLQAALQSRRSISSELAMVMRAAPDDVVVNMMARSIPLSAASSGVASLHDLQARFACAFFASTLPSPLPFALHHQYQS